MPHTSVTRRKTPASGMIGIIVFLFFALAAIFSGLLAICAIRLVFESTLRRPPSAIAKFVRLVLLTPSLIPEQHCRAPDFPPSSDRQFERCCPCKSDMYPDQILPHILPESPVPGPALWRTEEDYLHFLQLRLHNQLFPHQRKVGFWKNTDNLPSTIKRLINVISSTNWKIHVVSFPCGQSFASLNVAPRTLSTLVTVIPIFANRSI